MMLTEGFMARRHGQGRHGDTNLPLAFFASTPNIYALCESLRIDFSGQKWTLGSSPGGQDGWGGGFDTTGLFRLTLGGPKDFGGIAQLVERVVRNDEAWGSNPHTSMFAGHGPSRGGAAIPLQASNAAVQASLLAAIPSHPDSETTKSHFRHVARVRPNELVNTADWRATT